MNLLKKRLKENYPKLYRHWQMMRNPERYFVFSQGYLDPPLYNQDGLATAHNCDFMKDPLFMQSYHLGEATGSWGGAQPAYRAYVAAWAAHKAKNLPGDFVECGVNRGGLSRMVINYIQFDKLQKTFYLLDTFKGFDPKVLSEFELQKFKGFAGYPDCYESVVATFAPFKNVKIIRGTVPETLPEVKAERIAYLSIDMNCAAPEAAAVEYFWDKLVPGGVVLFDDYGFSGHHEQKAAHDAFARKHGLSILTLPTGQGLLIK